MDHHLKRAKCGYHQRRAAERCRRSLHGFSLIEFLVAIGILGIFLAILIPYFLHARELNRRTECEARLGQIADALWQYAKDQGPNSPLPETLYDPQRKPDGYTCFTGPDESHPFTKDSAVKPNDITASLWLLVRCGYVKDLSVFICPSTDDHPDTLPPGGATKRGNFRSPSNLSFSYACPFTDAFDFAFTTDRLPAEFAILADKNPGFATDGTKVLGPDRDSPPFELAKGNSPNHGQAGQNVLYADGHVEFQPTPFAGVGGDNIYTAIAPHRLRGEHPQLDIPGYIGQDIGPAYNYDSYLVPTAQDQAP
jgi:prepilin-type N-terminal cleavage/methylation domain-containing protein/prepilin-type processing-associated H-X9-DG protein